MSSSQGFNLLHPGVQQWVWQQQWADLRDIQERAIEPILAADRDVIISAATAAGKTEAAFLPACSRLANEGCKGVGLIYISPLKALINDQQRRLESLADLLDLPVTPWHGDVSQARKNQLRKDARGILLITPESLESLLFNQMSFCTHAFHRLRYIIIDEFHAFIGSERGRQLQSLMHRLEFLLARKISRIALSATLGELDKIARHLRHDGALSCTLIQTTGIHADLKAQLRGYLIPALLDDDAPTPSETVCEDLFRLLRGKSHLIFANSRERTEALAANLSERCQREGFANEFFPHHGNLAKELREFLEARLLAGRLPTSAVCTMTLELGIDIGAVDSIAQVTAPHSVASLRQRLGRSGRRGEAAVLRMFIVERELSPESPVGDRLRLQTFQSIAMMNLLLARWFEPPDEKCPHFSTLVQQILAVMGQYGGVLAQQLWSLLCETGPFNLISQSQFAILLRALAEHGLITQMQNGQLVVGEKGERLLGHFSFYAAFQTPQEFRVEHAGKVLGTLPVERPLVPGQSIIFAGKRWQVVSVDAEKKLIQLMPSKGGRPPSFIGGGPMIHDRVRQEMRLAYTNPVAPRYLDKLALENFEEGRRQFQRMNLGESSVLELEGSLLLFPWLGDKATDSLVLLLRQAGLSGEGFGGIIELPQLGLKRFREVIAERLKQKKPSGLELAAKMPDQFNEKYDSLLPRSLRDLDTAQKYLDLDSAWQWLLSIE